MGDEDDDGELLKGVFSGLAKGKEKVSMKDLLSWDLVLELMGEGVLTEDLLKEKMLQSGGDNKGVNIESFDKLVDLLVRLLTHIELTLLFKSIKLGGSLWRSRGRFC
jgi:hypothetical protein